MDRKIIVYVDLEGVPMLAGRLWTRVRNGKESATFEYDQEWISSPRSFSLEPSLTLGAGPHHTSAGKAMFGAIGDSAPDRWGRVLMKRAEIRQAEKEGRAPRALFEGDVLLMVDDEARQGALRFSETEGGAFLSAVRGPRIPPLVDLPRLLTASRHVEEDKETAEEIKLLLAPGSSLGGSRPKATVRDRDGSMMIAKFPHKQDDFNIELWESVALRLAARAGISVAAARVEIVAGKPVLLLRRFDRDPKGRVPFLSAMSMLGAMDREQHSYLEIADAIRRYGSQPETDLKQLWRRIAFSVLISNTDDHLRNHGFLYVGGNGWRLSPAYDLNPVPVEVKPRILSTAITMDDAGASLDLALSVAEYFNLQLREARRVVAEVGSVTRKWRSEAKAMGISTGEIARMASAFEHKDLEQVVGTSK
jgi:serine/threonine-protein kinase HipA